MAKKQTYEHTGAWRAPFLVALRKFPNISKAAKSAGVSRQAVYWARDNDAEFAQQLEDAWQEGAEYIEEIALIRATRKKNPSDTLIIFMLKGLKPETYRDHFDGTMTLRGSLGVHGGGAAELSDEELDGIERIYEQAAIRKAQQSAAGLLLPEPGGSEDGEGATPSS